MCKRVDLVSSSEHREVNFTSSGIGNKAGGVDAKTTGRGRAGGNRGPLSGQAASGSVGPRPLAGLMRSSKAPFFLDGAGRRLAGATWR